MDDTNINFDTFIEHFYSNNNSHIDLEINIYDCNTNKPTIYDLHTMLLELLINGVKRFNLDIINNLEFSRKYLQNYFNNIDIKIIIDNLTKRDLIDDEYSYYNRYFKFTNPDNMIINGAHKIVNELSLIKSFYLIDTNNNFSISFSHK